MALVPTDFYTGSYIYDADKQGGHISVRGYTFARQSGTYVPQIEVDFAAQSLPGCMAIDGSGNIYIAGDPYPFVDVFSPRGSLLGTIRPNYGDTGGSVQDIAFDSADRLYILYDHFRDGADPLNLIVIYPAGTLGNVPVQPVAILNNLNAGLDGTTFANVSLFSLGLDKQDLIYLGGESDFSNASIHVYPAFPKAKPAASGYTSYPAQSSIEGVDTALRVPMAIAFDSQDNLYVPCLDAILVFGAHAKGNVAPIRRISGPATKITECFDLDVDANDNLYVGQNPGDTNPGAICIFPPGADGDVAPDVVVGGDVAPLSLVVSPVLAGAPTWERKFRAAVTRFVITDIPDPAPGPMTDILIGVAAHEVASRSRTPAARDVQRAAMAMVVSAAQKESRRLEAQGAITEGG